MNYLKVKWVHQFNDEPITLLSELDCDRFEVRKIEYFSDGRVGYASDVLQFGGTMLGELPVPAIEEIAEDPQFVVGELTPGEFEEAWRKATV
jgi:hypothetical protein